MDVWVTEWQTDHVSLGLRVKQVLWREQTPFQELVVVDSEAYGRVLLLNGAIQTTERDEFIYHEMIAHVPLAIHPAPRRVAVIGGGDGGAVREILRHPVEEVHLVEIDDRVVEASRRFFPEIAAGLEDSRVTIHHADGIEWAKSARDFDVVLVDSTDPVGPAEGLFTADFYRTLAGVLTADGFMVAQSESPFLEPEVVQRVYGGVAGAFAQARLYLAAVPTYPSGLWTFTLGSRSGHLDLDPRRIPEGTRYWTPEVHRAAFQLPPFVTALIGREDAAGSR